MCSLSYALGNKLNLLLGVWLFILEDFHLRLGTVIENNHHYHNCLYDNHCQ